MSENKTFFSILFLIVYIAALLFKSLLTSLLIFKNLMVLVFKTLSLYPTQSYTLLDALQSRQTWQKIDLKVHFSALFKFLLSSEQFSKVELGRKIIKN